MAMNSKTVAKCIECGTRLPWADEAEKQQAAMAQTAQKVQAAQKAQQTASAPKSTPAKARPAKHPTLEDDDTEWWIVSGGGILILLITAFGHWRFTVWETVGGFQRMKWYTALLYSIGGKWLITGVGCFIGIAAIAIGIAQYFQEKQA